MSNYDDAVERRARVAQTPAITGDGYSYGENALLIIDGLAVSFGSQGYALAKEVADVWNAAIEAGRVRGK